MNYRDSVIASNQNKIIKHINALHSKKYRDQYNEYFVEGIKIVNEALLYAAFDISYVVFTDEYEKYPELINISDECKMRKITQYIVDNKLFKYISETDNPQGILCVIKKSQLDYELLIKKDNLNILLLDEIQDPGNLGTIIRTADAFDIDAVILSQGCVDLYNGKTIRSTMGSLFHIPIIEQIEIEHIINKLKNNGVLIIGADPYGVNITEYKKDIKKAAIIIGNEARGINPKIKKDIDISLRIPMPGKAESLNAGVAAALMIYEISIRRSYI